MNILVLTKPMSNYTFNPDECWRTLIMQEVGTGDFDYDGEATLADAVALQKYLLHSENFDPAQAMAADLNKDGVVNVFDLVYFKRMLFQTERA